MYAARAGTAPRITGPRPAYSPRTPDVRSIARSASPRESDDGAVDACARVLSTESGWSASVSAE